MTHRHGSIVLPACRVTKPLAQKQKGSSPAAEASTPKFQTLYFFVAFPSMNVIQFVPSIEISNFML